MPRANYKTCRQCGRHTSECGPLSHNCYCGRCSEEREKASIVQQKAHSGPIFQHWRHRIAASVGAVISERTGEQVSDG